MNDEVCFWHEYKNQSLLQVDTIIMGICNQAYPKYPKKVCISLEYLRKINCDEVQFLPAVKHKSFLQVDSIALSVHTQASPKYLSNNVGISL